jgi:HAMP domain-containing protein
MASFRLPLKAKLILSVASIVVLIVVGLVHAFEQQHLDSLHELEAQTEALTKAIGTKQEEASEAARQAQQEAVRAGVVSKGETLAGLLARQALAAVLTEDALQLDGFAEPACRDTDVVIVTCVFLASTGKPVSTLRNDKHPRVAKAGAGDLGALLARLTGESDLIRIAGTVRDESGTVQGESVVVLDPTAALQRAEAQDGANAQLEAVSRMVGDMRTAMGQRVEEAVAASQALAVRGLGCGIALSLAGALAVAWSITRPLRKARQLLEAVAAGDLRQTLEVRTRDDIGLLSLAANRAVEALCGTVRGLKASSNTLASSSTG